MIASALGISLGGVVMAMRYRPYHNQREYRRTEKGITMKAGKKKREEARRAREEALKRGEEMKEEDDTDKSEEPMNIRVLSQNCAMLPWRTLSSKLQGDLADYLSKLDVDIICAQELFHMGLQHPAHGLAKKLTHNQSTRSVPKGEQLNGWDVIIGGVPSRKASWKCLTDSGLAILSRYPLRHVVWKPFPAKASKGTDALAAKGVLVGRSQGVLWVNTHWVVGAQEEQRIFQPHCDTLCEAIKEARAQYPKDPVCVCGDFNVDTNSENFQELKDRLKRGFGLVWLGGRPTHCDGGRHTDLPCLAKGTCSKGVAVQLDHVFASHSLQLRGPVGIHSPGRVSDHLGVSAHLRIP